MRTYKNAEIKCGYCTKTFVPKWNNKNPKFCSRSCVSRHTKLSLPAPLNFTCARCRKKFTRIKAWVRATKSGLRFCSKKCSARARIHPRRTKQFTCKHCLKTTEISVQIRRRSYCSPRCHGLARRAAKHVRSSTPHQLGIWRRAVIARDGYECARCRCGELEQLQAHHILSFSEYPELRYNVNNGETLCIDCHANEHPAESHLIRKHPQAHQPPK